VGVEGIFRHFLASSFFCSQALSTPAHTRVTQTVRLLAPIPINGEKHMKIKYFSWMAEQSFKASPSGERLFVHGGGFWSKPYIIPNEETEKRLFNKQLWMLRILIGGLILGQPFLFIAVPNIIKVPFWLVFYLLAALSLAWLVNWLVFRNELHKLKRANAPISISTFYRDTAKRNNIFGLFLGFLGSIGFVVVGFSTIKINAFGSWIGIIFFGFCAIAWGYTFYLKLTMLKTKEVDDNINEA
jgi:hypothetical protein